ncbi:MAG: hypothetical protein U1F54_11005 [Burkholderiales bacterium]
MFAPRPDVAIAEMRRVLRPGGRIAFATWLPEHFIGRMFMFVARHSPPPPGAAPPPQWGIPSVVAERLGTRFEAPFFERGEMIVPALSVAHYRAFMEASVGRARRRARRLRHAVCAVLRGQRGAPGVSLHARRGAGGQTLVDSSRAFAPATRARRAAGTRCSPRRGSPRGAGRTAPRDRAP